MQIIYDYALKFVGIPYIWGGKSFDGIDCSGLMKWLLLSGGVRLDGLPNTQQLYDFFSQPKNHSHQEPALGALVFYGQSKSQINHVALCLSKRVHIEAAGGDSTTLTLADAKLKRAFVRITPIRSTGLVGIYMPDYPELPCP